ncbi:hypothetical protein DN826_13805 [Stutzerimonas nosocomialis]|uniref:STAS domain-containing protein n=1 Tax=Stutzerimonas nosocomialis TaxID=1056496 RepID=UPI0011094DD0|nr:STAS domain-containing protein [Stutzerimonas nosocomialis]TLX54418.1 hypothetical protein DN826_13805 [Stutzerimonas nosocomialis]
MLRLEVACTAERATFLLQGRLTLYEIRHAHGMLRAAAPLVETRDCYTDLRQIERLDIAAVQLLLALERQLRDNGRTLTLLTTDSVAMLLRSLGLDRLVALPPEAL